MTPKVGATLICGLIGFQAAPSAFSAEELAPSSAEVTNVHQLRALATQSPATNYSIRLKGDVWWVNTNKDTIVLKDYSGAEELELDLRDQSVEAGQRILLTGNGTITKTDGRFRLGATAPVVNNDGIHGMIEKMGGVYLEAGRNPIRVDWFNGTEKYGLKVEYEGPSVPRQPIPNDVLFRAQRKEQTGATNWLNGLDYQCCEANEETLPDFGSSPALKTGTTTNFDLSMLERSDHVGVSFTGYIDVPANGLYIFRTTSDDGSRLFAGKPSLKIRPLGQSQFPEPRRIAIGSTLPESTTRLWAEVEGKVTFFSEEPDGAKIEITSGSARMLAIVANGSGLSALSPLNKNIRATGLCRAASTTDELNVVGTLLVPGTNFITLAEPRSPALETAVTDSNALPLLTTAAEVHHLKREESQRGYPVKLRGVITSILPEHQAFTIQDSTRGLYIIDFSASRSDAPQIGELVEIDGHTDPSLFAPVVYASGVSSLGAANMPEPVHPTWDQLINGSLDAQYVEIQGIVAEIQTNEVVLLTPDGLIKSEIRLAGGKSGELKRFEDALIRVRGCLFATWDGATHKVIVGEIRIYGADISVDRPAPADLFSTPAKTAAELSLFDPKASVLQRVKVSGQIIRMRGTEGFMMDGTNGVRFIARGAADLLPGDVVEAVGFPELSSASPVLREAVAKKIGHAVMPPPRALNENDLVGADNDSTLVRVKAVLIAQRNTAAGQSLEMHSGLRTFLAWLPAKDTQMLTIPIGSQLELTGAYASQGGNRASSRDATSFELLLNSVDDVKLLARPPWWTLERLLIILGALACVLAGTGLWITQLRRKVEQRTVELETQIRERQRVEQQRALEQERARIAQDLHDELGSGLTEISMLGARARPAIAPDEKRGRYLEQMNEKARQLVLALDEIVWAMNPTHDSIASMISYFSLYADRFLSLANITWRLDSPFNTADHAVDSRHRHQLFLAFKEALTNVVHHSGATEVRFSIRVQNDRFHLTIADNGRGFAENGRTDTMDGLINMRLRLEKMGGRFELNGNVGKGASVDFYLPLN